MVLPVRSSTGLAGQRARLQATRRLAGVLGLIASVLVAGCQERVETPARTPVRLTTGSPGGGFYPLGAALATALSNEMPRLDLTTQPSAGAVSNIEAIEAGRADMGFAFADVAYIAFVGGLEGRPRPFAKLRSIAVLQLTPVHLAVSARSGIRRIEDLRGRRVGLGPPGSGTALTVGIILQAFGVPIESVHTEALGFNDAAERLRDGRLDAMFDNGNYPVESVRVATARGARLVPITGPSVDRLLRDYPFLQRSVIPRGTYDGQTGSVHTIGVDCLLLCRSDLDETLVHDLTEHLFEVLPTLASYQTSLRFMDLEQAAAAPVPLHEGAARYYREREFLR